MKFACVAVPCLLLSACAANSDGWVTPLKQKRGAIVTLSLNGWGGAHILVLTPERTVMDRHQFSTTPWRGKAGFLLRRDFARRYLNFALVAKTAVLEFDSTQWPLGGNNTFLLVLDEDLTGTLRPLPFRSRGIYAEEILRELREALPNDSLLMPLEADMDRTRGGG